MTLKEFKEKYIGKQIEFHSYGTGALNQCVDLVNAYINMVLDNETKDYTEIIGANAKDFKTKFDPDDFDWITNTQTPNIFAERGDIIVWNGYTGGGVGHVAIFLDGDATNFVSLDQNWSKVEKVTIENHTYKNVSGWLRPKHTQKDYSEEIILLEDELEAMEVNKDEWKRKARACEETCDNQVKEIQKINKLYSDLDKVDAENRNKIAVLQGQFATISNERDRLLTVQRSCVANMLQLKEDNLELQEKLISQDPLKDFSKRDLLKAVFNRIFKKERL